MKYAIIAAGQGSRLSNEGVSLPKPLVKVGNECLIDRLLRIFVANHADEIIVICNEEMTNVQTHLQAIQQKGLNGVPIVLKIVIRSTPSSMHSLAALRPLLKDAPFCLTTVDAIFEEDAFMTYVQGFKKALQQDVDAYMGVTKFVDDEKPLFVETDESMRVLGFHDEGSVHYKYVSAGIYGLHPHIFDILQRCIQRGEQRMRNFQRALIAAQCTVMAHDMGQVLDVDHLSDVAKAEAFLRKSTSQTKDKYQELDR